MSAEVLRRAAALMRERAEAAYDGGPWEVYELPDAGPNRWTMTGVGVVDDDMGHRADVFLPVYAEHIASWHPAVALSVAALLEVFESDEWPYDDCGEGECDYGPCVAQRHALNIARAYLGDDPQPAPGPD